MEVLFVLAAFILFIMSRKMQWIFLVFLLMLYVFLTGVSSSPKPMELDASKYELDNQWTDIQQRIQSWNHSAPIID
jgi:cell division protein FtsW (lipid II flippase)